MFHTFPPSYGQASQLQVETTCPDATLGIYLVVAFFECYICCEHVPLLGTVHAAVHRQYNVP